MSYVATANTPRGWRQALWGVMLSRDSTALGVWHTPDQACASSLQLLAGNTRGAEQVVPRVKHPQTTGATFAVVFPTGCRDAVSACRSVSRSESSAHALYVVNGGPGGYAPMGAWFGVRIWRRSGFEFTVIVGD